MERTRPKNLNLFTIRFPLPAIVSILHRLSGFILCLLIAVALWGLQFSLTNTGFDTLHQWLRAPFAKFILWLLLMPFCFHLISGIRHLFSDMHLGNTRKGGKMTALGVFIVFVILIILVGAWIW